MTEAIPFYVRARCLILGCGNVLYGDDGFGPAVASRLADGLLPAGTAVLDAGTGARNVLFDLLLAERGPEQLIVVDAVNRGRRPGELFLLDLDEIPLEKRDDFSLHQAPTSNLLAELREKRGTNVTVVACQSAWIPGEMASGLSPEVEAAVGPACARVRALASVAAAAAAC